MMITKNRLFAIVTSLAIVMVLVYFILPAILLKIIQRHIEQMEDYSGSIQAVHIAYLPLGLVLEGLQFKHKETTFPTIAAASILIKPHWPLFYKGAWVVDAIVNAPQINLVAKKIPSSKATWWQKNDSSTTTVAGYGTGHHF